MLSTLCCRALHDIIDNDVIEGLDLINFHLKSFFFFFFFLNYNSKRECHEHISVA